MGSDILNIPVVSTIMKLNSPSRQKIIVNLNNSEFLSKLFENLDADYKNFLVNKNLHVALTTQFLGV